MCKFELWDKIQLSIFKGAFISHRDMFAQLTSSSEMVVFNLLFNVPFYYVNIIFADGATRFLIFD